MNPNALTRIETDILWLTKEIGPRPAFSSEVRLATLGIRDRLTDVGWTPQFVHLSNNLITCSGTGSIVLLAHSDTVAGSPGALDNAVGVATLIEMGRQHLGEDLCLGFPAQEELGLIGARHLVEQIDTWHPDPTQIRLVLSLDLVGHGTLSVTGLNTQWDDSSLHTLLDNTNIYSEYGYQVVSRLLPTMERSDHAPFANAGYRTAHLLGRNEYGITPNYHMTTDNSYDQEAVIFLEEQLNIILDTEWSSPQTASILNTSTTLGTFIFPGWMVWCLLLGAILLGVQQLYQKNWSMRSSVFAFISSLILAAFASLISVIGLLPYTTQEIATQHLYGLSNTGWWMGSLFFLPLLVLFFFFGHHKRLFPGTATGWWGLSTLGLLFIDPVLALPWAVSTFLSWFHPLLGLLGVGYWLQPNILRELATHGLLPPIAWFLLGLLCWPALLCNSSKPVDDNPTNITS